MSVLIVCTMIICTPIPEPLNTEDCLTLITGTVLPDGVLVFCMPAPTKGVTF